MASGMTEVQPTPAVLVLLQGEITLRGLRIRRGTHPAVQDEDRVYPWTSMRLVSDGPGGRSCVAFDESGNPVAKWLVPESRRSMVRRVLRRAYVRAVRKGDLSVAEHVPGRGEAVVVISTLCIFFLALGGLAVHDQANASGGLANVQPSQLLWRIGGLMLFVLPIALFLLPLVIAPLRCNVAWWRLSIREGFEATLRTGEVERRAWSAVRRIRTSGLLVTVEFADGLVLRSREQQRSGCILDAWRERNEPGYRAPSRWGPLARSGIGHDGVLCCCGFTSSLSPSWKLAGDSDKGVCPPTGFSVHPHLAACRAVRIQAVVRAAGADAP